jgi:hypothetical protein
LDHAIKGHVKKDLARKGHVRKDLAKKEFVKKDLAKKDHAKKGHVNGLASNHLVLKNSLVEMNGMKNLVKDLHALGEWEWEEDIWDHLVDLLDLDLVSDLDHISDSEDLGEDRISDSVDLGEDHHVKDGENHLAVEKNAKIKSVRKKKMKRKSQKLNKIMSLLILINHNNIIK